MASVVGETDFGSGAPELNSAGASEEEGSEAPSAGFATPNPNPTGLPILPPTFPKVNPLPLGGEPPPNVPKALLGLSGVVTVGPNVGVKEAPNKFPDLGSSFPASLFVETLLNRSEDPGVKGEGLLESVLVPNSDVAVVNAEVGFEDGSENADDDAKKLGMAELEPKADDEESSLPLLVVGAGGAAKENEVDFDEPASSELALNENADFGASEVLKGFVGMGETSLGLAPKVGTGTVLVDDVENEKAPWGAELLSVLVLLFVDGVGNDAEPNPENPEKPFGTGNPVVEGAVFSGAGGALGPGAAAEVF